MNAKRLFIIISIFILCIGLLYYGLTDNGADSNFRWISPNPALSSVMTTTGKALSIPFEFRVEKNISEISVEIADKAMEQMGVHLDTPVIQVNNGVAASTVTFRVNKAISDGHHKLKIIAKDKVTGNVISTGIIPFNVNMLDIIWKCSC